VNVKITGSFVKWVNDMDDIIAIHKQVEWTLRRLTVIAERAREGIVVFDLDGVIQFVNTAWAEMHGYKGPDELIGKQISTLRTKGRTKTDVAGFIEKAKQRGQFAGRLGCVRKDGTPFAAEMLMVVFNDEAGEAMGLVGFASDLTEQERTKDELRQYRSHMEELVSQRTEELEDANARLQRQATEHEQAKQKLKQQAVELKKENEQLQEQISKHERAEDELKLHRDKLEQRLEEQGGELTVATARLQDEINERKQQESRLKRQTNALRAASAQLQSQIDELSAGPAIDESDMLASVAEEEEEEAEEEADLVKATASCTDDETALLENVFKHNIELQMQHDDAADDEG
jgi:PAS domain S-box-containing protein